MTKALTGLKGTVADVVQEGTIAKGTVIMIEAGQASEYMTEEQCVARQTLPDTPFIMIQVGIPDHGVVTDITFKNYAGRDGGGVISPNTMHGKIILTYPDIRVEGEVNMIAVKREKGGNSIMTWKLVTV